VAGHIISKQKPATAMSAGFSLFKSCTPLIRWTLGLCGEAKQAGAALGKTQPPTTSPHQRLAFLGQR
jgi:hypothetical protein